VSGKKIFLNHPLTKASNYKSNSNVEIGYFSSACKQLTDDALVPNPSAPERKGILIMNCSCPFVNVDNNIREQAIAIQEMYRNRGIYLVAVAVCGSGINVRFPPSSSWVKDPTQITSVIMKKFGVSNDDDTKNLVEKISIEDEIDWFSPLIGTLLEFIDEFIPPAI